MFLKKKRYSKLISALLVCCMVVGAFPLVAKAGVTTDMFQASMPSSKIISSTTVNESSAVKVTHETDDGDWNCVSTKNSYDINAGVRLKVQDIQPVTSETGYSFMVYIVNSFSGHLNYTTSNVTIMAFSNDGRYKIWKPLSGDNARSEEN